MEVDTQDRHLFTHSCSYDHVVWTVIVAWEALTRKINEMSKPYRKDIAKFDRLVREWKGDGVFMRPRFGQASNGMFADQVWWDNDSKGVSFPNELEDPDRLADLVQAKAVREFTINEWLDNYWGTYEQDGVTRYKRDEYPIWPEEYLSHPGMTRELFKKLFLREPTEELIPQPGG